jgi:hypothetical protein
MATVFSNFCADLPLYAPNAEQFDNQNLKIAAGHMPIPQNKKG